MSHTSIQIKACSISKEKQKGFVKIKKGVKVLCYVNRHEGDDDDGCFDRILTIKSVKVMGDFLHIYFEEILSDEPDSVYSGFYIKKEK